MQIHGWRKVINWSINFNARKKMRKMRKSRMDQWNTGFSSEIGTCKLSGNVPTLNYFFSVRALLCSLIYHTLLSTFHGFCKQVKRDI